MSLQGPSSATRPLFDSSPTALEVCVDPTWRAQAQLLGIDNRRGSLETVLLHGGCLGCNMLGVGLQWVARPAHWMHIGCTLLHFLKRFAIMDNWTTLHGHWWPVATGRRAWSFSMVTASAMSYAQLQAPPCTQTTARNQQFLGLLVSTLSLQGTNTSDSFLEITTPWHLSPRHVFWGAQGGQLRTTIGPSRPVEWQTSGTWDVHD